MRENGFWPNPTYRSQKIGRMKTDACFCSGGNDIVSVTSAGSTSIGDGGEVLGVSLNITKLMQRLCMVVAMNMSVSSNGCEVLVVVMKMVTGREVSHC